MGRKINMTGWNMWEHGVPDSKVIVLKENPNRSKDGHIQWNCQCAICGNYFTAVGKLLRTGNTKSDGCYRRQRASEANIQDLTGKKFGRLSVEYMLPTRKNNKIFYHCICECGAETDVSAYCLTSGKTKSCGCLQKEITSQNFSYDLVGQKFGQLTVIERKNSDEKGVHWLCQCSCGQYHIVITELLTSGKVQSCGCIRYSIGEKNIENILQQHNIKYLRDKVYFKDLINDTQTNLRYDFILFNNDIPIRLIEFDGPQHNKLVDYYGGEATLKRLQYNDTLKNEYAHTHNIPLVRIPYKERDKITLEMLMSDQYLVKEKTSMTNKRILELLKIERECIARGNICERNCASCELVQNDKELLEMYDTFIKEKSNGRHES